MQSTHIPTFHSANGKNSDISPHFFSERRLQSRLLKSPVAKVSKRDCNRRLQSAIAIKIAKIAIFLAIAPPWKARGLKVVITTKFYCTKKLNDNEAALEICGRLFFRLAKSSCIKRAQSLVTPPVQMNTDLSTTARAFFFSLALSTKPIPSRTCRQRQTRCAASNPEASC